MYLEIITPEQTLFKGEVDSVLFPGSLGDFQVLNNHAPIVSTLKKGEVKIIGKLNLDSSVRDQFEISDKETILKRLEKRKIIENRSDDNTHTIISRYEKYMETTQPVLNFYSENPNFKEIDGSLEIEEITRKIDTFINV